MSSRNILLSRFLTHAGDQAWDFAVPLALVSIFPANLDLVALYYLSVRFLHMLLVTRVCAAMDGKDRLVTVRVGIGLQTAGVAGATAAIAWLVAHPEPGFSPGFLAVVLAGLAASLGASMTDIAVSQDWLPIVVPRDQLPRVNSRLKQIDLATELGAPIVAGLLFALKDPGLPLIGFYLVAGWNALSFWPEYRLLRRVYVDERALAQRGTQQPALPPSLKRLAQNLIAGWRDFVAQPAAPAIVAYACLWLTVLSPHGVLLAAWLKSEWGLSEVAIGVFRGLGAVFGLLATVIWPGVARRLPLVAAARLFIVFEAICLIGAAFAFAHGRSLALTFAGLILLSRVGLYGFSLGETQIRQVAIPAAERGRVNGFAQALTSLATLGVYGAATQLKEPAEFGYLVFGSVAFVAIAAIIFTAWSLRHPNVKTA